MKMFSKTSKKVFSLLLTFLLLSTTAAAAATATPSRFSIDLGPYTIKGLQGSGQILVSVDEGEFSSVYGTEPSRCELKNNLANVSKYNNINITQETIEQKTETALRNIYFYSMINEDDALNVIYV